MKANLAIHQSILTMILLAISITSLANGQDAQWLSGAQFDAKLQSPITSTWNQPLRDVVQSLRDNFSICIFTDRRIDPEQVIELQVEDLSLEQTLRRLALTANADLSFVRNVVYLGPSDSTSLLATVAAIQSQNLKSYYMTAQPNLFKPSKITWKRPANPRNILQEDAAKLGLKITNPESIPFDQWDTGQLAALPFAYRTTILLAGFSKTFQLTNESTFIIIDYPQQATYRTVVKQKVSSQNANQLRKQFPTLEINSSDSGLTVAGRWEEVHQLERLLSNGKTKTTKPATIGMKVYTLTVENQPVQAIIQAIAQQEKLTVQVSAKAQELWTKRVSLEAIKLSLSQLLTDVTTKAMLKFEIEGNILSIDAADN